MELYKYHVSEDKIQEAQRRAYRHMKDNTVPPAWVPNCPFDWHLVDLEVLPLISKDIFDSTGVRGLPRAQILSDKLACLAMCSNISRKTLYYSWPANFNVYGAPFSNFGQSATSKEGFVFVTVGNDEASCHAFKGDQDPKRYVSIDISEADPEDMTDIIIHDLTVGAPINETLGRHSLSMLEYRDFLEQDLPLVEFLRSTREGTGDMVVSPWHDFDKENVYESSTIPASCLTNVDPEHDPNKTNSADKVRSMFACLANSRQQMSDAIHESCYAVVAQPHKLPVSEKEHGNVPDALAWDQQAPLRVLTWQSDLFPARWINDGDGGNNIQNWLVYDPFMLPQLQPDHCWDHLGVTGIPAHVFLSDAAAFQVMASNVTLRKRAILWPADFDSKGNPRVSRPARGRAAVDSRGIVFQLPGKNRPIIFKGEAPPDHFIKADVEDCMNQALEVLVPGAAAESAVSYLLTATQYIQSLGQPIGSIDAWCEDVLGRAKGTNVTHAMGALRDRASAKHTIILDSPPPRKRPSLSGATIVDTGTVARATTGTFSRSRFPTWVDIKKREQEKGFGLSGEDSESVEKAHEAHQKLQGEVGETNKKIGVLNDIVLSLRNPLGGIDEAISHMIKTQAEWECRRDMAWLQLMASNTSIQQIMEEVKEEPAIIPPPTATASVRPDGVMTRLAAALATKEITDPATVLAAIEKLCEYKVDALIRCTDRAIKVRRLPSLIAACLQGVSILRGHELPPLGDTCLGQLMESYEEMRVLVRKFGKAFDELSLGYESTV